MKELTGRASATTPASPDACMRLLEAIDGYPAWAPDVVKQAEVVERDVAGHPTKARTTLHVERGPLTRDFKLVFEVKVDSPGTIALRRVANGGSDKERFDVTWRVSGGQATKVALELVANLDVPRLVPLGGVGDSVAESLVSDAMRALGR